MSEEPTSSAKELKAGDRLWFTLAEPPSAFETRIARQLSEFCDDSKFFHVQIFSWRSAPMPSARDIISHLPELTHTIQDRCIGFHEIGDAITVKVPMVTLTFSNKAAAGDVRLSSREICFEDQLLVVIGCRQTDHDAKHASLHGAWDAIGYLSLIFGKQISNSRALSAYFSVEKKKFVDGTLEVKASPLTEESLFGIKSHFQLDAFLGDDAKTHRTLWFSGRAFVEKDRASKIIFYYTAMEMACGKRPQDYFRSLYRGLPCAAHAIAATKHLQRLRNDIVHRGTVGDIAGGVEREVQVLILDALMANQSEGRVERAFSSLIDAKKSADS